MAKYTEGHPLVAYNRLGSHERAELKAGDEVIVSTDYGRKFLRLRITRTTDTQFTLSNGSRYMIRSGEKIGAAGSYSSPTIVGVPTLSLEEAERQSAAIVAAAVKAQQAAELADILDRVEALADKRGDGIGQVLEELNDLNIARLGEAIRANEATKAGQ